MIERKTIDKIISYSTAALACFLIMIFFLSMISVEVHKKPQEERQKIFDEQRESFERQAALQRPNENLPDSWPPKMNVEYVDLELFDQAGQAFRLHDLRGKVLIVEYVDMSSPVSQAQSGAKTRGAYGVMQEVDEYTGTFEDMVKRNIDAVLKFPHDDIIELKIIVYTQDGEQPSRDDAQNWAAHFGFTRGGNVIVAIPRKDIRGPQTQDLVTGYQLVDKNLNLRVDAAGLEPKHSFITLSTMVPKLLQ